MVALLFADHRQFLSAARRVARTIRRAPYQDRDLIWAPGRDRCRRLTLATSLLRHVAASSRPICLLGGRYYVPANGPKASTEWAPLASASRSAEVSAAIAVVAPSGRPSCRSGVLASVVIFAVVGSHPAFLAQAFLQAGAWRRLDQPRNPDRRRAAGRRHCRSLIGEGAAEVFACSGWILSTATVGLHRHLHRHLRPSCSTAIWTNHARRR